MNLQALEDLRAAQEEQRRFLAQALGAMLAGCALGWIACEAFTLINAARIAGGW